MKADKNLVNMPTIGFGTYLIPNEEAQKTISIALKIGYRHIDTCLLYTSPSPRDMRRSRMPSSA